MIGIESHEGSKVKDMKKCSLIMNNVYIYGMAKCEVLEGKEIVTAKYFETQVE